MSAHRGKADIPPQGRDFRFFNSDIIEITGLQCKVVWE